MKKLATLLVLFIVLLGNTILAQTENSNSLTELLKNQTYKANYDRAKALFNDDAMITIAKIAEQNTGKLTEAEKTAHKITNYYAYKNSPQNFSANDKRTFFYFLNLNPKYNNKSTNKISDNDIMIEFARFITDFENQMRTNSNLKNTEMPYYSTKEVSADDL